MSAGGKVGGDDWFLPARGERGSEADQDLGQVLDPSEAHVRIQGHGLRPAATTWQIVTWLSLQDKSRHLLHGRHRNTFVAETEPKRIFSVIQRPGRTSGAAASGGMSRAFMGEPQGVQCPLATAAGKQMAREPDLVLAVGGGRDRLSAEE